MDTRTAWVDLCRGTVFELEGPMIGEIISIHKPGSTQLTIRARFEDGVWYARVKRRNGPSRAKFRRIK